ncbi:hypothetical protein KKC97_13435 [bacterium]|nr:hypothetical protein [bacterium]MBU1638660.1 hypothetical protein [bacterium]MBU1920836.1 hypothetical protein [bacterium]
MKSSEIKQASRSDYQSSQPLIPLQNKLEQTELDLKRAQEMLLQQEKLASIGQLAAGVAHEINNPIAYIQSNLQALERYMISIADLLRRLQTLPDSSSAEEIFSVWTDMKQIAQETDLEYVLSDISQLLPQSLEGVVRIRKIVNDLKGFSRADEAKREAVDIHDCIEAALNIVWNELKYHVTLHRQFGELPKVDCYPQQLTQVFVNLLINAGQAISEKGEVFITTTYENGLAVLRFADTGTGIPEELLPRIFDPFVTTKEVGKGTGLGLSIVYSIIEKHGGKILAANKPGEGAEFRIELPISQTQDE